MRGALRSLGIPPAFGAAAVLALVPPVFAEDVEIPSGTTLRIEGSTKIRAGACVRPPLGPEGKDGVLVLRGVHGATLDLEGVDLRGTPAGTDLDRNAGFGIVLEDCEDVTVKAGKLGGYKGCLVARRCKKLVLDGMTFDGWHGMHLLSTSAAEDQADWLYPHENDKDEWITNYGAAISLTDCSDVTIKDCSGRHGQNGILLTRSNGCTIYDADFSFLSGWGLALYRSSKNVVSHCLFDYCVRGYSDGVYWRGQDSAGILLFERCSDNLFALNSASHGGDGVFLFAGNDLVAGRAFDRGEKDVGGCDRNIWFRNDFSFAVANAIEATFSRDNWALENKLDGSHQHGIWGGYSSRLVAYKNHVEGTLGGGISIEHGQECVLASNWFRKNQIGIELWWDEDPDLVGGPYGKHRDTASRDHVLIGNEFAENEKDLVITKTDKVVLGANRWSRAERPLEGENMRIDVLLGPNGARATGAIHGSSLDGWDGKEPEALAAARAWKCPPVPGKKTVFARDRGEKQGLDTILVGEWGPWDFRGGEPKPKQRVPGGLFGGCTWRTVWFSWKAGPDPREKLEAWRELAKHPAAHGDVAVWTNPYGGDPEVARALGNDRFGLVAKAEVELREAGKYRLRVVSDDGVRVLVDGKVAFEDWTWHAPQRGEAEIELAAGKHDVAIEYFQIDGAMALGVELSHE
jgi:parallel beta-helix repeat protein